MQNKKKAKTHPASNRVQPRTNLNMGYLLHYLQLQHHLITHQDDRLDIPVLHCMIPFQASLISFSLSSPMWVF